jgi:hypothetical protein
MSDPEPSRPRFRLQTLVFVVVILGMAAGLIVQQRQFQYFGEQIRRLEKAVTKANAVADEERKAKRAIEMEKIRMMLELNQLRNRLLSIDNPEIGFLRPDPQALTLASDDPKSSHPEDDRPQPPSPSSPTETAGASWVGVRQG